MNLEEIIKEIQAIFREKLEKWHEAIEAGQTEASLRKDLRDASVVIGALMGRLGLSEVLLTNEELPDEESSAKKLSEAPTAYDVWFEWVPSGKWIRIKRK